MPPLPRTIVVRGPCFTGGNPKNVNWLDGMPLIVSAASTALAPGTGSTAMPSSSAARINWSPGSESSGVPASVTTATDSPCRSRSSRAGRRAASLWACRLTIGVSMPACASSFAVRRVSSAAITRTSRSTRSARSVMSSRLPMGVATTYKRPGAGRGSTEGIVHWEIGPRRPSGHLLCPCERMRSAETLPHFAADYLAWRHEVQPTAATFDGVHVHDDLLEDFSRAAIDRQIRDLNGFARRLASMTVDAIPPAERADHAALMANAQGAAARARGHPHLGARPADLRRHDRHEPRGAGHLHLRARRRTRPPTALQAPAGRRRPRRGPHERPRTRRHLHQDRHRDAPRRGELPRPRPAARAARGGRPLAAGRPGRCGDAGQDVHRTLRARTGGGHGPEGQGHLPDRQGQARAEAEARGRRHARHRCAAAHCRA